LPTQRAVGELGGQRRVGGGQRGAGDAARKEEIGVRARVVHGAQRVVGDSPGRLDPTHVPTCSRSARSPRSQSAAGIAAFPAGCTVSRAIGVVPVPTSTVRPTETSSPGARRSPASVAWARRTFSRAPSIVVNAPGSG